MKKSGLVVSFLIALLFAMFAVCVAWAQEEEEDAFGNMMNNAYVKIDKVDFAAPSAGAPCKVTATLSLIGAEDFEDYKVVSAKLNYVVNGKDAKSVDMSASGDVYSGEIPGQAAGAKVDFFITIVDSLGNTTTEAIPLSAPESAATDLVAAAPDVNNSSEIVPDGTDILGTYVGYDKDNIYVRYDLQAEPAKGSINPPNINVFGIKFSNPDKEPNEGLMVGKLWLYLPLARDKEGKDAIINLIKQTNMDFSKLPAGQYDYAIETGFLVLDIAKLLTGDWPAGMIFGAMPKQIKSDDSKVFIGSIPRSIMGENPSGFYRVVILTLANTSLESLMPVPLNCSHFMQIYTSDHSYTVK